MNYKVQSDQEGIRRAQKAVALVVVIQADRRLQAGDLARCPFDTLIWKAAAAMAGVNPPSQTTVDLVVDLLHRLGRNDPSVSALAMVVGRKQ